MAAGQRDLVRERRWRERVASWQATGLTIREFCRRHGLAETAFHFWRRELQARDAAALPARKAPVPARRPTFVPVAILPNPASAVASVAAMPAGTIEIRCPSGHVVTVPVGGRAMLRHLFAALAQPFAPGEEVSPC